MNINRNLISILILILLLAACGGKDDGGNTAVNNGNEVNTANSESANMDASSNADDDVTIVTFAVNEFEQGLYESRIEAFEKANPGIRIEIVNTGEITGDSFAGFGEFSDENVIDLVKSADVIAMKPTRTMIEQKLILDLSPLMAGDSQFDASDFFPNILEQYQQGGGTWGLPLTADFGVIVFDKAKFDAAGVAYPEAGWTWAEFISAAQALTNKSGESVQWGFNPGFMTPLAMIEAKAERPLLDTTTQPTTVNLEHPDVVAAFQWYADLAHLHGVMPAEEEGGNEVFISSDGSGSTSSDSSAAMWIETTDFINGEQLEADNLGVVPFPIGSAGSQTSPTGSSFGLGNVFVVSAGSSKTDAAWTWLKFLSQQSAESGFFDSASLPARRSAAETSGYWDDIPESLAGALRYASEHAFNPSQVSFDSALQSVPFEIVQGQQDVQSVLAKAQAAVETAVKKEADTLANATPVPSFEVAEPPSEQVPEGATVITFVVMGGLPDTYRELAKQFQQTHPDIVVKVEEPNYFGNDFSLSGLVGEADCFQSFSSLDNPEDLQAVISVQPFIDSDPELNEADFYQAPLNAFKKQGQLMGLPGEATIKVLAFDKRIFDAAGRPYPQPGWTMDEFLETAVALTQGSGENKTYGFKPSIFEESDLLLMMSQLGASFVDDNVNPPQTSFMHPDTIAAMRWYANLATEYGVKPPPADNSFGSVAIDENFGTVNNAAIWAETTFGDFVFIGDEGEAVEQDTSHIGYVPYPAGGSSAGYENVTGYFISSKTQQRQACWEWTKFLSSQPGLAESGIPAHIGAAESDAYAQLVGSEKASTFRSIMVNSSQNSELSRFMSGASWLSITSSWLNQAHTNIVNNGMSVEEAMQQAQSKSDAYRSCVIEKDAFTDGEKLSECITEVDPDLFG